MMTEREEAMVSLVLDMLSAMQKRSMAISEFLSFPGEGGGDVINLGVTVEQTYTELFRTLGLPDDNPVSENMLIYDFLSGKITKQELFDEINAALEGIAVRKCIRQILREKRLNIRNLTTAINRVSQQRYGKKFGGTSTVHRVITGERPLTKSSELDVFACVLEMSRGDLMEAIAQ